MNNFCIVPWYDAEEWHKVYSELSHSASNKENALSVLLVWKARCPFLPSGVESTLCLLQVYIEDIKQKDRVADDHLLRLAYSSAVMRFVNHMLDTETIKGSSLYQAARNLGVPDWIVDLRHDTAHGNNLPPISLLREACSNSLQWLLQNYWNKYKPDVEDYIPNQKEIVNWDVNKISVLINLCTSLSICAHPSCKIKNLSEIPNLEMRESIINDVKDLFGDLMDMSNLKTVSITSIINVVDKHSKDILNVPAVTKHVNEALLGEDSLFMSRDLLYHFCANDIKRQNRFNNSYMQCFEVLLTFLHTNDLLLGFILELVTITQNSKKEHFKARVAALWLSEILLALKRSYEFSLKLKKSSTDSKQIRKKKELKQLYHHWFPSIKGNNLLLDLQKAVPDPLQDINFAQTIISVYNPYLSYFIRNLLDLINPAVPSAVAERIFRLIEVISSPEKFPVPISTLYTADDIITPNTEFDDDVSIEKIEDPTDMAVPVQHTVTELYGIWKLAEKKVDWALYPYGKLVNCTK